MVVAGSAVLVLWVVAERLRIGMHGVRTATLAFVLVAAWRLAPEGADGVLRLRVMAVGNAAGQLLILPNGRALVCDLGSNPLYDLVQWTAGPLLAHDRIPQVDAAVISHPNLDHYSSIPDLAERYGIDQLLVSPFFAENGPSVRGALRLVRKMAELKVPVRVISKGAAFRGTGEAVIEVLWPPAMGWRSNGDPNEESLVLSVSWSGRRILLCGDIGPEAQSALISSTNLKADVLVLPHHGKLEPTTPAFLRAVNPKVCIRSSGRHDADQPEGIRSVMAGRVYFNTADVGAVRIDLFPGGIRAYTGHADLPVRLVDTGD
jgi:competence protein ComEC